MQAGRHDHPQHLDLRMRPGGGAGDNVFALAHDVVRAQHVAAWVIARVIVNDPLRHHGPRRRLAIDREPLGVFVAHAGSCCRLRATVTVYCVPAMSSTTKTLAPYRLPVAITFMLPFWQSVAIRVASSSRQAARASASSALPLMTSTPHENVPV